MPIYHTRWQHRMFCCSAQIPFIQQARLMSQRGVKMFASPWSAPAWMKTNHNMSGNGTLIGQPGGPYYKTWANYFVR